MKRSKLLLLTPLLLAGCIQQSASYYIESNQHALSLRAEQEYFWKDDVVVKMAAARLPECQRLFPIATLPIADFNVELFSGGDNVYSLRSGKQTWRFETQTCTQLTEPTEAELGTPLGVFRLDAQKKLVFAKAASAPAAAPAEVPAS
ncbi:MAG: hypothetical protein ABWY27_08160 [Telluria sp.]